MRLSGKVTGSDKLLRKLESYDLNAKVKKLLERLAEIGVEAAARGYSEAEYSGVNDVTVDTPYWKDERTIVVSAHGKAITFIEFGAGVHYSETHPMAQELGFNRGGYGFGLGKNDSWRYKGQKGNISTDVEITEGKHKGDILTKGNPPSRAMFNAGEEMRREVLEIAKEVFAK